MAEKPSWDNQASDHDMGCKEKYIPCGIVDLYNGQLHIIFGSSYEPIPLMIKRDNLLCELKRVYHFMAGRFEGLSDLEWKLFEDIFPTEPKKRGKGMPHAPYRHVLNSLLYLLITGCRWCDLPSGGIWASKSASHRWLKRWYSDGTFAYLKARILAIADERGLINWDFGAIDGSFSPCPRRR